MDLSTLPPFLHLKAEELKTEYESSPVSFAKFIEYDKAEDECVKISLTTQISIWSEIYNKINDSIKLERLTFSNNIIEDHIIKYNVLDKINKEILLIQKKICLFYN